MISATELQGHELVTKQNIAVACYLVGSELRGTMLHTQATNLVFRSNDNFFYYPAAF
jgi:hypothetical protein